MDRGKRDSDERQRRRWRDSVGGETSKIATVDLFLACRISRWNRDRDLRRPRIKTIRGESSATRNYAANRQAISAKLCVIKRERERERKKWTAIFQELSAVDKRNYNLTKKAPRKRYYRYKYFEISCRNARGVPAAGGQTRIARYTYRITWINFKRYYIKKICIPINWKDHRILLRCIFFSKIHKRNLIIMYFYYYIEYEIKMKVYVTLFQIKSFPQICNKYIFYKKYLKNKKEIYIIFAKRDCNFRE